MSSELIELVYQELRNELNRQRGGIEDARRVERALVSDSIPAYTVANLPTIANGGIGNGSSYVTLAWASNGRKAAEGVGTGTGQLVYYNNATNQWLRVRDDSVITA